MKDIKVSVIIPVYNASEHLGQCLDSVFAQTLKEIEVICVDDGSTDGSLEMLNAYAKEDGRLTVIHQENAGAGSARNTGLAAASGKYLSFLDADDFAEPSMLEKAFEKAEEQRADFVVFNSDQYYQKTDEYRQVDWTIRKKELPPYRPMYFRTFTDNVFKVFVGWAWDKLFLREFVNRNGLRFQEIRTSNDMRFVFMAVVLAGRIDIVDEVLIHQRRNQASSLSNTRERSWHCFHDALISLRDELSRTGLYNELEQDYINYALHASLWNLNTINGPRKEDLFNRLKDEWFAEFGISGRPESYFYNRSEYRQYCAVTGKNFGAWEGNA